MEINEISLCPVSKGPAKGTLLPGLPLRTCEKTVRFKNREEKHLKQQNTSELGEGKSPLQAWLG